MTSDAPTRGPVLMLAALAALLVAAGVLPWVAGGSAAARGFAAPLLLVGLFAAYVTFRATRPTPTPARTPATPPPCAGCQCGAGTCAQTAGTPEA